MLHKKDVIDKLGSPFLINRMSLVKYNKFLLGGSSEYIIYDLETERVHKIKLKWPWSQLPNCYAIGLNKSALLVVENHYDDFSLSVADSDEGLIMEIFLEGIFLAACSPIGTNNVYLLVFNLRLGKQLITKFSTLEDLKLLKQHFITKAYQNTEPVLPDMDSVLNFQVISHTDTTLTIWALIHQASVNKHYNRYDCLYYDDNYFYREFQIDAIHFIERLQDIRSSHTFPCILVELILSENNANVKEQVIACGLDDNYCELCENYTGILGKQFFHSYRNHHEQHINCNTYDIDMNSKSSIAFNGVDVVFVSDYKHNAVHQFRTDGSYIGKCLGPHDGIESPICITYDSGQLLVGEKDRIHTFILTNPLKSKLNNVVIKWFCTCV